ncbi:hypothetical protein [Streptomyces sirii]|uniref:hypothetical protein n=1 Tax=Streptomyces sirii TaxID=3127701 RepID=UPI003D362502
MLPKIPGMPECRAHDSLRHGITSLFATFKIADGPFIGELPPLPRRQFKVKAVPRELDVHLVCDNYASHNTAEIA